MSYEPKERPLILTTPYAMCLVNANGTLASGSRNILEVTHVPASGNYAARIRDEPLPTGYAFFWDVTPYGDPIQAFMTTLWDAPTRQIQVFFLDALGADVEHGFVATCWLNPTS